MSNPVAEGIGDNKECGLAVIGDYTFQFNDSDYTSADDTEYTRYIDYPMCLKDFCIRTNQTLQIISFNGVTLTNPITVIVNKSHTENLDTPTIFQMVIRTQTVNTDIKIRMRGRLVADYN